MSQRIPVTGDVMRVWFRAWVARHIVSPDPYPEYSRLDRLDGLGRQDTK